MKVTMMWLLAAAGVFRLFELFWLEHNKQPGKICASWTKPVLGCGFAAIVAGSIGELLLVHRSMHLLVSLAGLSLMIARMPLKYWAARTLNVYWSPQIEIRDDHRLITSGPYRYLRHPAYLGVMLDFFGVPLFANAFYTLSFVSPLLCMLLLVRMFIEEKALIQKFGRQYIDYRKQTFALLPISKRFFDHGRKLGTGFPECALPQEKLS